MPMSSPIATTIACSHIKKAPAWSPAQAMAFASPSDLPSIPLLTRRIVRIRDGEIAVLTPGSVEPVQRPRRDAPSA